MAENESVSWTALSFGSVPLASRGALNQALRRGLFQRAFGPTYYRGFVDSAQVVGVPFEETPGVVIRRQTSSSVPAYVAFGVVGALAVVATVGSVLAVDARKDFQKTDLELPAARARQRYDTWRYTAIGTGAGALLGLGVGLWLWDWGLRD